MREEVSRYFEIAGALVKLGVANVGLLYYALPRSWRGGYQSPWERNLS